MLQNSLRIICLVAVVSILHVAVIVQGDTEAEAYAKTYETYKNHRVVVVQRTWRVVPAEGGAVFVAMNRLDIRHAGLLLIPAGGKAEVPLVAHKIPGHFTVVEEITDPKFSTWEFFGEPILVKGNRTVQDFVDASGPGYSVSSNNCIHAGQRMIKLADPNEIYLLNLKKLKGSKDAILQRIRGALKWKKN